MSSSCQSRCHTLNWNLRRKVREMGCEIICMQMPVKPARWRRRRGNDDDEMRPVSWPCVFGGTAAARGGAIKCGVNGSPFQSLSRCCVVLFTIMSGMVVDADTVDWYCEWELRIKRGRPFTLSQVSSLFLLSPQEHCLSSVNDNHSVPLHTVITILWSSILCR